MPLLFQLRSLVMLNWNESLEQLTMKRCSDPKCELVFPQLVRGLRKLLEKCSEVT